MLSGEKKIPEIFQFQEFGPSAIIGFHEIRTIKMVFG